jgi:hypothetical protein
MYLAWTDDVPIVYPPYTCATGNVQDECLALMGFMSADRHNPLPHIALSTTAPKSAYKNNVFLSTCTSTKLLELLIPGRPVMAPPDCSSSSRDEAELREVCYRARAAASRAR